MPIRLPKIFLDSGDPAETKKAKSLIGRVDGQTTNPTLIARHPEIARFLAHGKKLTEKELLNFYRQQVEEIEKEITGPISVEVYGDWETKAKTMLKQAEEMSSWGKNIQIKFLTIPEGLKAASEFIKKGGKVNMTLVFDQIQSAAVYSMLTNSTNSTNSTNPNHFLSPFLGRWDDRGFVGLDFLKNIIKMYKKYRQLVKHQSRLKVLAASIRNLNYFYGSIFLGADIMTVPLKVLTQWVKEDKWIPGNRFHYDRFGLKSIPYQEIPLEKNFQNYPIKKIKDSLLDEGIKKFVADWKNLLV
jgi:transaldolase